MSRSFWKLVLVQFREFFREPAIIFWSIIFPVAIASTLGAAFSDKPEVHQTVGLAGGIPEKGSFGGLLKSGQTDNAGGVLVKTGSEASGEIILHFRTVSPDSAILLMKRGIIQLYVLKETDSTVSFHFDKANSAAQLAYLAILSGMNGNETQRHSVVPMTLPGTRYIDFLIPGLMMFGVMNSFLWGIGFSLIEFRMKKLLRRMLATPMKRHEFILSVMVARLFLAMIEAGILLGFSWFFFGIYPEGSWIAVLLLFLTGAFAFTGISLLIAARIEKTNIGIGFINAVSMPMMVLSGIFFSYHNFPPFLVSVIQYLPLTLLADATRAVFVEGAGLGETLIPVTLLLATGMVTFLGGLRLFRWH